MENNNEENKIQEAQILEPEKTEEKIEEINSEEMLAEESAEAKLKKGKRDFYIELGLFLILGILVGIAIKTEAVKRITMGFDDYKMKIERQDFDINKIQADLNAAQIEAQEEAEKQEELQGEDQINEGETNQAEKTEE